MRFERVVLLIALGLALGWGLGATNEPTKIGFVDAQQVIASSKSGKAAREELERKLREAEGRIAPLVQEYETKKKELEAKRFVTGMDAVVIHHMLAGMYARDAALHFCPWYSNAPRTMAVFTAAESPLGCTTMKSLPPVSPTTRG